MEPYDNEDTEFNSEEVQKIAKAAVETIIKPKGGSDANADNVVYQKDKVN